jgi:hypothetical protein
MTTIRALQAGRDGGGNGTVDPTLGTKFVLQHWEEHVQYIGQVTPRVVAFVVVKE